MKNVKYKLNSWVVSLAVIVAVVLINIIATNLSDKLPIKFDLTKGGKFQITEETKNVVTKINSDIKISVLGAEDTISPEIKEYISRYSAMSNMLKFEYIDVYKNQGMLQSYQAKGETLTQGDMVFESNGRYKIVKAAQIYSESNSLDKNLNNYNFDLESKMTNAIVSVLGLMEESTVYLLQGHGEQEGKVLPSVIKDLGNKLETISIVNTEIPNDTQLLISFAPNADFSQAECEKIDKFLEKGGNLLVVYAPGIGVLPRLDKYMTEWGITPNQNMVIEKDKTMIAQNEAMYYPKMAKHEITKNLIDQKLPLLFIGSIDFTITTANVQKATVSPFIATSDKAIGKKDLQSSNTDFAEGDTKGPFYLAAISEKTYPNKAKVMAIGSLYALELPEELTGNKANTEFAASVISYLTNNNSNLKIAPKVVTQGKVSGLTQFNATIMYYGLVWILPLVILAIGIIIWLRRRYL